MKRKKIENKVCRHCGGPLRRDVHGVSCFMCSRGEDHKCERCIFIEKNDTRERKQYKAA